MASALRGGPFVRIVDLLFFKVLTQFDDGPAPLVCYKTKSRMGMMNKLSPLSLKNFNPIQANSPPPSPYRTNKSMCLAFDTRRDPRLVHFGVEINNTTDTAVDKMKCSDRQLLVGDVRSVR